MNLIEKGLHKHHARMAEQAQNPSTANQALAPSSVPSTALEAPFAKVNSVVVGSPAEAAGLRVGDTITKFGWVDWTNHERLSRVAEAVSQNEGVSFSFPYAAVFGTQLTAHRFPSRSRRYVLTLLAAHQRQSRCSSHHGETGAVGACWAATCCPCESRSRP